MIHLIGNIQYKLFVFVIKKLPVVSVSWQVEHILDSEKVSDKSVSCDVDLIGNPQQMGWQEE